MKGYCRRKRFFLFVLVVVLFYGLEDVIFRFWGRFWDLGKFLCFGFRESLVFFKLIFEDGVFSGEWFNCSGES